MSESEIKLIPNIPNFEVVISVVKVPIILLVTLLCIPIDTIIVTELAFQFWEISQIVGFVSVIVLLIILLWKLYVCFCICNYVLVKKEGGHL